jgi:hypothetical protein
MTPQKTISIDFSEIPALEITCKACTGRILLPLPLPKKILERIMDCPSCGKRLWENENDGVYASVAGFARALGALKETPHKTISLGFTVSELGG